MPRRKSTAEQGTSAADQSSKFKYVDETDLVRFVSPSNPPVDLIDLMADIVSLDHRSQQTLRPFTREREEVKRLLWNAVNQGVTGGNVTLGRELYERAEQVYYYHVQTKNRLFYLVGVFIGVILSIGFGYILTLISAQLKPFFDSGMLVPILLFAGMGSITSVLIRLLTIDLSQTTDIRIVLASGASKPLISIFFALIVYLILSLQLIDIKFVNVPVEKYNGIYLISSFLCGFSERFAKDILSRVSFSGSEPANRPDDSQSGAQKH